MFSKKEVAKLKTLLNQASSQQVPASSPAKKKKRSRKSRAQGMLGASTGLVSRVKYTEVVQTMKVLNGKTQTVLALPFNPATVNGTVSAFPVLAKFARIYESYKIHNITLHWSSSVAATKDGLVILSVDSNPTTKITSVAAAEKLRPCIKFPVRTPNRSLVVPVTMLQPSMLRYVTATATLVNDPVALVIAVDAGSDPKADTNYGVFSVTWDVSFIGISPTD